MHHKTAVIMARPQPPQQRQPCRAVCLSLRPPSFCLDNGAVVSSSCLTKNRRLQIDGEYQVSYDARRDVITAIEGPWKHPQRVSSILRCRDLSAVTHLHIFDIDGTLLNSPNKRVAEARYQAAGQTFSPELRRGFFINELSLRYPAIPLDPREILIRPVAAALAHCHADPTCVAVLLTGRVSSLRPALSSLLHDVGFGDVPLITTAPYGEGPPRSKSRRFKHDFITELAAALRPSTLDAAPLNVTIWEDDVDHGEAFRLELPARLPLDSTLHLRMVTDADREQHPPPADGHRC